MRLKRWGLIVGFILFLISGAVFLMEYRSRAASNKIFGNMIYLTKCPYIAEKVTLVNGYCETTTGLLHHSMYYDGEYVYGDFNRDGLRDAAVVVGEGEGGSEDFKSLAFLIHDGTHFVHRKSAGLGSSAIINSLKERDGKVFVDMFVRQDGDCMAGPTKHVKSVFEYGGDRAWIEGKQVSAKSFFDPIILILKEPPSWAYVLERWRVL